MNWCDLCMLQTDRAHDHRSDNSGLDDGIPIWVRSLRDQCSAAGVPFLFKQWGEWAPSAANTGPGDGLLSKVGKRAAGRRLDGREHSEWPSL